MKIVVIGGTGLIGSSVVTKLSEHGHQAIAAAGVSHSVRPHGDTRGVTADLQARYFGVVLDDALTSVR